MKSVVFSAQARADVRRLDQPTVRRIFAALHRFAESGTGDIRRLRGNTDEMRLRVGDWRVRFTEETGIIRIIRVLHRSKAYR